MQRCSYLLGLEHLVLKDVCDAVPDHLQPAGAVGHHVAIPVHGVSCGEVIRHSFITAVRKLTPLNTHCETGCLRQTFTQEVCGTSGVELFTNATMKPNTRCLTTNFCQVFTTFCLTNATFGFLFYFSVLISNESEPNPPQLTQWGPRWHHALELRLDHRRRSLELGSGMVDEKLHRNVVQPREGRLLLRRALAVF